METLHRRSPDSNSMMSSKIKNNILKTILASCYREWLKQWKCLSFMEMKAFVFSVEGFQFFKFHENEAKPDFKRCFFSATLREVWLWCSRLKIHQITVKIGFNFCKLTFLGVSDKLFANLLKYMQNIKVLVGIKFGKGLLTSVLDSLTTMIEFCQSNNTE